MHQTKLLVCSVSLMGNKHVTCFERTEVTNTSEDASTRLFFDGAFLLTDLFPWLCHWNHRGMPYLSALQMVGLLPRVLRQRLIHIGA